MNHLSRHHAPKAKTLPILFTSVSSTAPGTCVSVWNEWGGTSRPQKRQGLQDLRGTDGLKGTCAIEKEPSLCMKLKQQSQGVLHRQRSCPCLKGEFQGVWVWWSVCSDSFISLSGNWESGQSLQEGVFGKAEADKGILNKTGVCRYSILSKLPKGNVQIGT